MADEIDKASEHAEQILAAQLSVRKPEPGPHTGFCLFCDEQIEIPKRYCDVDCAADHEKEQRFKQ